MAASYVLRLMLRLSAVFACVWVEVAADCGAITSASDTSGSSWTLDSSPAAEGMDVMTSRVWNYYDLPAFLLGGSHIKASSSPWAGGSNWAITINYNAPVKIFIAQEALMTGNQDIGTVALADGWVAEDVGEFHYTQNGVKNGMRAYSKLFLDGSSVTLSNLQITKWKGSIFSGTDGCTAPATTTVATVATTVTTTTVTTATVTTTITTTTATTTTATTTVTTATGVTAPPGATTTPTVVTVPTTATTTTRTTTVTTTTFTGPTSTVTTITQTTTTTAPKTIIEFTVNSVNFAQLETDASLLAAFHQALQTRLANTLPGDISAHYVEVSSSQGTASDTVLVEVLVTVHSSAGKTAEEVEAEMQSLQGQEQGSLPPALAADIEAVSGIAAAKTSGGTVTVTGYIVRIMTTSTTTTISSTTTSTSSTTVTTTTTSTTSSTTNVITTATSTTTAAPDPAVVQVFAGQTTLQVSDADAFLTLWSGGADKEVYGALAASLAAPLPGVTADMVVISSVAKAARRLAAALRRLQGGSGVVVDYEVSVPQVIAVEQGLTLSHFTDNPQAVTAKLNEHLANSNSGIVVLGATSVAPSVTMLRVDPGAPGSMSQGSASEHAASGSVVIMGLLGSLVLIISLIGFAYTIRMSMPLKPDAEEVVDVEMDDAFSKFQVVEDPLQTLDDELFDVDAAGNRIPPDIPNVKATRRYM